MSVRDYIIQPNFTYHKGHKFIINKVLDNSIIFRQVNGSIYTWFFKCLNCETNYRILPHITCNEQIIKNIIE